VHDKPALARDLLATSLRPDPADFSSVQPTPIDELNATPRTWCTDVAGRREHGTTRQRPLEQFERVALRPLPRAAYDLAIWKQAILYRDCYVVFEGSYYSAPYRLVGQTL
jgi:hypothetical protein